MASDKKYDNIDDIQKYYQENAEDERPSRQPVEFLVTTAILDSVIPDGSRVLEIGAGTGHYTSTLLNKNCQVTAVELVPELAKQIKNKVDDKTQLSQLEIIVGDIRNSISTLKDDYDCALIMGPMYHLEQLAERQQLLKDVSELVKSGGSVISAHLSRTGFFSYMLSRYPNWAKDSPQQVLEMLGRGFVSDHPRDGSFRGYFTTLDELIELHQNCSLKNLVMYCQDPLIGGNDALFLSLSEQEKAEWLNIFLDLCADPLALGSGRSLLTIAGKGS